MAADLDYLGNIVVPAGAAIRDQASRDADLRLPGATRGTLGETRDIVVDGIRPKVASVTSSGTDGPHGIGSVIDVRVTFGERVVVVVDGGGPAGTAPSVPLETGGAGRDAYYVGGSGTLTLVFEYVVQQGDEAADLDHKDELSLNDGNITDRAGNPANLTLPAASSDNSRLGEQRDIAVDGVRPTVASVTSSGTDGPHGIGSVIDVRVTFDEAVVVDNSTGTAPSVPLETGGAGRDAYYVKGSDTETLVFEYVVQQGDEAADLDHKDELSLNDGNITDRAGNPANLTLPAASPDNSRLGEQRDIVIDTTPPMVMSAGAVDLDELHVAFDGPVVSGDGDASAGWSISGTDSGGLSIDNATLGPRSLVLVLKLDGMMRGTAPDISLSYDGIAGGIEDRAGNPLPSADNIAVDDRIRPRIVGDVALITGPKQVTIEYTEAVDAQQGAYGDLRIGDGSTRTFNPYSDGLAKTHTLEFEGEPAPDGAAGSMSIDASAVLDGAAQKNRLDHRYDTLEVYDGRGLAVISSEITGHNTAVVVYTRPAPAQPGHYADIVVDGTARRMADLSGNDTRVHTLTFAPGGAPPDATGSVTILVPDVTLGDSSNGTARLADGQDPEVRSAKAVSRTMIRAVLSEPVVVPGGEGAALGWSVSGPGTASLVVVNASGAPRPAPASVLTLLLNGDMPGGTAPPAELALVYDPDQGGVADPAGNPLAAALHTGIEDGIAPEVVDSRITGPNEAEIVYSELVWALPGAYGSVVLADGSDLRPDVGLVYGNGTETHTISFGGAGAAPGTRGTLGIGRAAVVDGAGNRLEDGLATLRLRDGQGPAPAPLRPGQAGLEMAVFTARNTATIEYSDALGPPDGHGGGGLPVYASVTIGGEENARNVAGVGGLGTAVHTVMFDGAGVDRNQTGTVVLAVDLTGTTAGGMPLQFDAGPIDVSAGRTVHAVILSPDQPNRAAAIEPDGFTREVNAAAAGPGARPAVDVSGLVAGSEPGSGMPAEVRFPAEPVTLAAEFATVMFPPDATARPAPPGGVLFLRALQVDERPPLAAAVAAALGYGGAGGLELGTVVEAAAAAAAGAAGGSGSDDSGAAIAFDRPVRIFLPDQSGGRAFYVNGSAAAVAAAGAPIAPIDIVCGSDDVDRVHGQLNGTGECHLDLPGGGSGSGKAIYTYHLTLFGSVRAAATEPPAQTDRPEPSSVSVLRRAGGDPLQAPVSYTAGQDIAVEVRFTAPVDVDTSGGAPYLELRTGSAGARAVYTSGSGTDALEFSYAVRGGDLTGMLSYAGTGALYLDGGAIEAVGSSGPNASTVLPVPGAPGSLSGPDSPAARIDPEPGRPVLDVGILDGAGDGAREAALAAADAFNERQGRADGALLVNATAYGAGTTAESAAKALRAAHANGTGPSVYVGPSTDRGLHAAMPYAAASNIVLVSAGSTAPSLAVEDDWTFRLSPGGRLDAEALARLARTAGAQSMIAVLENATHGPPTAAGTSLEDATPPPPDSFSRAFDAALGYVGTPLLSDTITLEGAAGGPYEAAAAAEALDEAAAAARFTPAAVVYAGSPDGLAALAAASASYPALASAAWIASSQSAGSLLLAGDGPAAAFAAQAGLQAVQWSLPANDLSRAVDSLVPPLLPGDASDVGARHRAYAAYDAMSVIGTAAAAAAAADTRGDTPDAAAVAELIPGTAAAYDGALGDIALNNAGDLWVPAAYDLWTVARQGGADPEWALQQGELDETRACSIALTRAKIDYGPIDSGQTSRPHLQTIVNTGQLPFSRVDLTSTPWHVDSPGNCEPGDTPSLPVGLSEIRTVQGGAFSDLVGTGTVLAQGLEAGSRSPLWYRLSLAGYADLPQAEITQCATYVVRCG